MEQRTREGCISICVRVPAALHRRMEIHKANTLESLNAMLNNGVKLYLDRLYGKADGQEERTGEK